MSEEKYQHKTVFLYEAINCLKIRSNGIYIDGTFGLGGHSRLLLSRLGTKGRLIAFDRDPQAIAVAAKITDPRFSISHGLLSNIANYIQKLGLEGQINGILLDLGVSSPQLDDPKRGFSFMRDGPLDMRMDQTCGLFAAEWLMKSEKNISWVLKNFGEERFANRIARAIIQQNRINPITRTHELATLITKVIPFQKNNKHPATRSFQAIRIYINNELEEIKCALNGILKILAPEGCLSIISFHSLEDRIIKKFIHHYSCNTQLPTNIPLTESQLRNYCNRKFKNTGKIKASKVDVSLNPRARSAILRFAERTSK
ncbi:Ribosomal RNA small subunit methyltransferase H [Candidatus Profftia lariciata]|uniref:16S rRNA (cytosine(1402)-N(4))-methyltransferase RsmH n=1 Tax=Candidatus Profftia lariciata TaxID=1987921 RepID=UPI001D029B2D|nr:16S rRNA (cytosine(1402)-N(4))-methyltransferase RsmH [Candidatus Profftia lariciata]UDG81383.1 Ribosomal RNA small subunit methyltransferase H [Candidatus Profftia lariciata]